MDIIVGSSSSDILKDIILSAGGPVLKTEYEQQERLHPDSNLITTGSGLLPCQRVFFVRWKPSADESQLRQSIRSYVSNIIEHAIQSKYGSIALPAIGCGNHDCSIHVVVETMVTAVKSELTNRAVPLTVNFVIQPDKQNVYDEFCKHLFPLDQGESTNSLRSSFFLVSFSSDENPNDRHYTDH